MKVKVISRYCAFEQGVKLSLNEDQKKRRVDFLSEDGEVLQRTGFKRGEEFEILNWASIPKGYHNKLQVLDEVVEEEKKEEEKDELDIDVDALLDAEVEAEAIKEEEEEEKPKPRRGRRRR